MKKQYCKCNLGWTDYAYNKFKNKYKYNPILSTLCYKCDLYFWVLTDEQYKEWKLNNIGALLLGEEDD